MANQYKKTENVVDWVVGDSPLVDAVSADRGLAAAIGNFDGVHLGHKKVVDAAKNAASFEGLTPSVITFDPHPREFFRQDEAPFHLSDRQEKDRLLSDLVGQSGPARIIHVRFDDALRTTDANDFITNVLVSLRVRHLFAGTDFAFGKGRGGDLQMINEVGKGVGISATAVPLLVDENSAVISSSRIRAALQAGDPKAAASMLGRDWAVTGTVIKGDARGRSIGFPTANIALGPLQRPAFGVYAVEVDVVDKQGRVQKIGNGVTNIGIRPTVKDRGVLCETHLFDCDINLYDKRLIVRLKAFLRPEQKFSGIDELISQITLDAEAARQILLSFAFDD
ncbi:bifunctional riboflavin kinase/FAD synthetase [Candidatus Puniceispirillum sp.]|nr:bifunctional riboflavin kinase/FAD synthetase [Candidatus Puniceispirillum sp.]